MSQKRILTIVVETDGAEDCPWIWDSHKDYILQKETGKDPRRHGVTVIGLGEGNYLTKHRELEEELGKQDEYVSQLEVANSTLTPIKKKGKP